MNLIDLPTDILVLLPKYLHDIKDYINTASSCRTLRSIFSDTNPKQILQLAAASSRVFFRPDPYFLVAATARQVSDWALQSSQNTETLRKAFMGGIEGLYELCISQAGITMEEIRRLLLLWDSTIGPVEKLIDKAVRTQAHPRRKFWNRGAYDVADTVDREPMRAVFQIAIYGELFGSTFQALLQPQLDLPRFNLEMRLDYCRYCIPDRACMRAYPGMEPPKAVGPYSSHSHCLASDQVALRYLLTTHHWWDAFKEVQHMLDGPFYEEWKEDIWWSLIQSQGLQSLQMMSQGLKGLQMMSSETQDLPETFRSKFLEMRRQIHRLEKQPEVYKFGKRERRADEYPSLNAEISVLVARY